MSEINVEQLFRDGDRSLLIGRYLTEPGARMCSADRLLIAAVNSPALSSCDKSMNFRIVCGVRRELIPEVGRENSIRGEFPARNIKRTFSPAGKVREVSRMFSDIVPLRKLTMFYVSSEIFMKLSVCGRWDSKIASAVGRMVKIDRCVLSIYILII